jgi:hypothetical protein
MARLIETSHVEWDPGTRYGYHGGSFGFIVDELCRRLAGRTAGQILHEIAVKLGHPDCYIGLPQPYMKRVAKLQFLEPDQRPTAGGGNPHPRAVFVIGCPRSGTSLVGPDEGDDAHRHHRGWQEHLR